MSRKPTGMTVAKLLQHLKQFPDDMPVVFSYNYGDHWRTEVAEAVRAIDEQGVEWSDYHSMFKISENGGDEDGNNDGSVNVVVLS